MGPRPYKSGSYDPGSDFMPVIGPELRKEHASSVKISGAWANGPIDS
jgi:hypothetical protein